MDLGGSFQRSRRVHALLGEERGRDGQQDEADESHTRHAVGLEAVRRRAHRVTRVVAGAVGDHAGVTRIVFLDVEDDLHQVGADVSDLGEDAARDAQGGGAQRLADGEAEEALVGDVVRHEQQHHQHQQQFHADEQHADRHACLERDLVDGVGLARECREGRARVGEGVDADTEGGDEHRASDTDQAEQQDDQHLGDRLAKHQAKVGPNDGADEHLQDDDELDLREQVRLAGFVNQLRHFAHGGVHRQVLQLAESHQTKDDAKEANQDASHKQVVAGVAAEEGNGRVGQVGHGEVELALVAALGERSGRRVQEQGEHRLLVLRCPVRGQQ